MILLFVFNVAINSNVSTCGHYVYTWNSAWITSDSIVSTFVYILSGVQVCFVLQSADLETDAISIPPEEPPRQQPQEPARPLHMEHHHGTIGSVIFLQ